MARLSKIVIGKSTDIAKHDLLQDNGGWRTEDDLPGWCRRFRIMSGETFGEPMFKVTSCHFEIVSCKLYLNS